MQRFNYKLSNFIKAIEIIAKTKDKELKLFNKSGSGIRFELFNVGQKEPANFWVIHTEHNKAKKITSKQDYKKTAYELNVSVDDFIEVIEGLK